MTEIDRLAQRPHRLLRPPAARVEERHVSESTRSGLGALAATLPADSPLAKALKRFVKNAG